MSMEDKKIEPKPGSSLAHAIYIGHSVTCPTCGEFDEGEPALRHDWRGVPYEQDWKEVHECPICGTWYEYENGNY